MRRIAYFLSVCSLFAAFLLVLPGCGEQFGVQRERQQQQGEQQVQWQGQKQQQLQGKQQGQQKGGQQRVQQQGGQRQGQQQTGRPQGKQQQKLPVFKPLEAERAKATALTVQGVDDAKAVVMDRQVSLAVKVTNFQRLRLKQIRREVHGKLSKQFPDYELHVTSDNKLFQELEKIEKEIASRHKDPAALQKLKKKLEKVNKDMKG